MNYYNDTDPNACEWAKELIRAGLVPDGEVDGRSITDIKAHELSGFTQCHFFAGILGWPLALQLAGASADEPTDTGSCPCQPFSGTGKQMGFADPRHLWPAFRRIIVKRRTPKIYGEQVASKLGREWLARVFSDLAFMGYAGSGADLCSAGEGSPNIRQRLYWVGDATDFGQPRCWDARAGRNGFTDTGDGVSRLEHTASDGRNERRSESNGGGFAGGRESVGVGHSHYPRPQGRVFRWDSGHQRAAGAPSLGMWDDCEIVHCRDNKLRRIESGSFPLAHGLPSRVGPMLTELRKLGRSSIAFARANRNLRLKGYGNAINPVVAARFIEAHRGHRLDPLT